MELTNLEPTEVVEYTDTHTEDWYELLIDDLKTIYVEKRYRACMEYIECMYGIGRRILQDEIHITQGGTELHSILCNVCKVLGLNVRRLYDAVNVARKYPTLDEALQSSGKNVSWGAIVKQIEAPKDPKPKPKEIELECPFCNKKFCINPKEYK